MIRLFATIFAGLLGLAFGSFLNVCLSRWPAGESVVKPASHCRSCGRSLSWWENIPLLSWIALRGHCRTCKEKISWRYPLVELSIGVLWAISAAAYFDRLTLAGEWNVFFRSYLAIALVTQCILMWLLVALALLDAEHFWLPNWLTIPGTILGFVAAVLKVWFRAHDVLEFYGANALQNRLVFQIAWHRLLGILAAAALILLIRWIYWLVRRREGVGLGDAKLMAMLAAWLGLPGALLAFALGVVLGAIVALVVIALPKRDGSESRAAIKLPLGTFLCIGGIVSALWGQQIIAAYLRYSGF